MTKKQVEKQIISIIKKSAKEVDKLVKSNNIKVLVDYSPSDCAIVNSPCANAFDIMSEYTITMSEGSMPDSVAYYDQKDIEKAKRGCKTTDEERMKRNFEYHKKEMNKIAKEAKEVGLNLN